MRKESSIDLTAARHIHQQDCDTLLY